MMRRGGKRISSALAGLLIACAPRVGEAQAGVAVRAWEDPTTGDHWVLERDVEHPGGPGRLVRSDGETVTRMKARATKAVVIHSGDRVVVEEKTAIAEARFEGVALGAASNGETIAVRLMLGGRIVHAAATAPGRAQLVVEARR